MSTINDIVSYARDNETRYKELEVPGVEHTPEMLARMNRRLGFTDDFAKGPDYRPYCMRCSRGPRMVKVTVGFKCWNCDSVWDLTAASDKEIENLNKDLQEAIKNAPQETIDKAASVAAAAIAPPAEKEPFIFLQHASRSALCDMIRAQQSLIGKQTKIIIDQTKERLTLVEWERAELRVSVLKLTGESNNLVDLIDNIYNQAKEEYEQRGK